MAGHGRNLDDIYSQQTAGVYPIKRPRDSASQISETDNPTASFGQAFSITLQELSISVYRIILSDRKRAQNSQPPER